LAEHSSTNTKRPASILPATSARHAAQELIPLTRTPASSIELMPIRLKSLLRVVSLTDTPVTCSTKRHLSSSVTAGLFSTSASSNLLAFSSSLGLEPGGFFGVSRFSVKRYAAAAREAKPLTPKVLAAWVLDIPFSTPQPSRRAGLRHRLSCANDALLNHAATYSRGVRTRLLAEAHATKNPRRSTLSGD
jgi:hypothetical protein